MPSELGKKAPQNSDSPTVRERLLRRAGVPAIAVLTAVALAACSNTGAQEQPRSETTSISTEAPNTTATPDTDSSSTEQPEVAYETYTVEELQIPAGLSDEEFGRLVVEDRLTKWVNAGANEGLLTRMEEEGLTWEELLPKIADENRDLFVEALIEPSWRRDGNTQATIWTSYTSESIERLREWNLSVLRSYVATQWSDSPEDNEGYRVSLHVEGYGDVWSENGPGYSGGDGRVDAIFAFQSNGDQNSRGGTIREDRVFHAMFQDTKVEGEQEWIQGFMLSAPTER